MRLLLDECVPRRLRKEFMDTKSQQSNKQVSKGWKTALLKQASELFDVLITVDKTSNINKNKAELPISVLILAAISNRYESLSPLLPKALTVIKQISKGEIIRIEV